MRAAVRARSLVWPALVLVGLLALVLVAPGVAANGAPSKSSGAKTPGKSGKSTSGKSVSPSSASSSTFVPAKNCTLQSRPMPTWTVTPWAQKLLQFDKVWPVSEGQKITVAVIDTGFDGGNEQDQVDQMAAMLPRVETGLNTVPGETVPGKPYSADCGGSNDERGHGSQVAALIGAPSGHYAFTGVAPQVHILPIKAVADDAEQGALQPGPVAAGIIEAVEHHVQVINISLDFTAKQADGKYSQADYPQLLRAVEYAKQNNVVIVAAAGNIDQNDPDSVRYPAAFAGDPCCDNVISVGSIGQAGAASDFSVTKSATTVVAPGENIVSLQSIGGYVQGLKGTSFASPLVAGVVALMRSAHPQWTPQQIRRQLEYTAQGARGTVPDPKYGYGVVDPYLAVTSPLIGGMTSPASLPPSSLPAPQAAKPVDRSTQHRAVALAIGFLGVAVFAAIAATVWRRAHGRADGTAADPF